MAELPPEFQNLFPPPAPAQEKLIHGAQEKRLAVLGIGLRNLRQPLGRVCIIFLFEIKPAEGKGGAVVPFALSDPLGKWTLKFRDVASGLSTDQVVELR